MSAWTDLFAELKKLYGNVSALLLDADRAMDQRGFQVAHVKPNQIGIDRSGDINQPEKWAPAWIARFYRIQGRPPQDGPLAYIACILSDGGKEDYKLPAGEPVLTAGLLHYLGPPALEYWHAKCWLWSPEGTTADGSWYVHNDKEPTRAKWLRQHGLKMVECFALPLVSIDSRSTLDQRVIQPLWTWAHQQTGGAP